MAKTLGEAQQVPTTWTTGWTDIFNTGTWRSAIPVHRQRPAPCHVACPVSGEIPTWIQHFKNGEYEKAWQALAANNPFPAVTGRVCHHPCELECNRKEYDEKVSVRALERSLGDMALDKGWKLPGTDNSRSEKIAVIGAGPAGLSAAYQLMRKGFAVTVFEARPKPGGLLTYGIPAYRLPREDILNVEMERLLNTDIELKTGTPFNDPATLTQLKADYAAVFVATGLQRKPKLEGLDNQPEYLDGLKFLEQLNTGTPAKPGDKVVVIGGGNTAVDAARSALRLGSSEVTILYRRDREQMPARVEEIVEAEEEGVKLEFLGAPVSLTLEGQKKVLLCQRMQLGDADASGRQRPVPVEGKTFTLELDSLIGATGAQVDAEPLEGVITGDGQAAADGFFAGGDLTSPERYVSTAIGAGHQGAKDIARYLGLADENNEDESDPVTFNDVNTFYFPSVPTLQQHKETAAARAMDFREVEAGIPLVEALAESERCFSCGNCLYCDNCYYFCPDMAVQRDETLEEGYRVLDQYCKGCGLCAAECPRGVIALKEEIK